MKKSVIVTSALLVSATGLFSPDGSQRAVALPLAAPQAGEILGETLQRSVHKAAYNYQVFQIQSTLNELGYDAGPADGQIGSRTRGAITSYQRDQGLLVTGQPSQSLLDHIRSTSVQRQEQARQARDKAQQDLQSQQAQQSQAQQSQASTQASADRALVLDIQSGLRRLGYDVPVVSGRMDVSTNEAVRAYQRDQRLLVDGQASEQLLAHIRSRQETLQVSTDRGTIMQVQERLNARGYDAGPADGFMGEKTRNAIRTFQTDANIDVTGRVTGDVLAALGVAAKTANEAQITGTGVAGQTTAPDYRVALSDDFADGNYTSAPRWNVLAGDFAVNADGLLISEVKNEPRQSEDVGKELLKGVLGATLGVSLDAPRNAAAIHSPAQIGNSFRIEVKLSGSSGQDSGFSIGPYQGSDVSYGYRLESRAAASRPLRLVVVNSSGPSVIASADLGVDLQDGKMHTLLWQRGADGRMNISVDDALVLEAKDEAYKSSFDGFSLINTGGRWSVDHVTVKTVM